MEIGIQDCTKITLPGCVKLGEKVVFFTCCRQENAFFTTYSHNLGRLNCLVIDVKIRILEKVLWLQRATTDMVNGLVVEL